jgi:hypothetical protein
LLLVHSLDEKTLQFAADVADLIKEECVAISRREKSIPVFSRVRESAFAITKQLGPHCLRTVLTAGNCRPVRVLLRSSVRTVLSNPRSQSRLAGATLTH